jgi:hypothetical protein
MISYLVLSKVFVVGGGGSFPSDIILSVLIFSGIDVHLITCLYSIGKFFDDSPSFHTGSGSCGHDFDTDGILDKLNLLGKASSFQYNHISEVLKSIQISCFTAFTARTKIYTNNLRTSDTTRYYHILIDQI